MMTIHTFNEEAFRSLSPENQQRVEIIFDIAMLLMSKRQNKLSTEDFDNLYDLPLNDLRQFYTNIRTKIRHM